MKHQTTKHKCSLMITASMLRVVLDTNIDLVKRRYFCRQFFLHVARRAPKQSMEGHLPTWYLWQQGKRKREQIEELENSAKLSAIIVGYSIKIPMKGCKSIHSMNCFILQLKDLYYSCLHAFNWQVFGHLRLIIPYWRQSLRSLPFDSLVFLRSF